MAMAMVTLLGRLKKDPRIFPGQNGKKPAAAFNVAVMTKNGEEKVFTDYNVKVFGNIVDTLVQPYLKEGTSVLVLGSIQQITSRDYQGKTYLGIDVFADKIQLAGDKGDNAVTPATKAPAPAAAGGFDDDDVPF